MGVSAVGHMAPMANLLRPHICVVTKIGLEHYTAFRRPEAIATEKGALVEALPDTGIAFLNADDPHVMSMAARSKARIVTFGRGKAADYRVIDTLAGYPRRLVVTVRCAKGEFKLQTKFVGEEFWLATIAAFAVGVELGTDPEVAKTRIAEFQPIWDRCDAMTIEGGPTFLIDTAKAPNESIEPTFAVLEKAEAKHKRVVLGTISDYRGNGRKPYRNAYAIGRRFADQMIFVGETSHRVNAPDDDRKTEKILGVSTTKEASEYLKKTARADELILLKGSRNFHLERIALNWTRTVRCWELTCGKSIGCLACGLVEVPYADHGRIRRAQKRAALLDSLLFWWPGRSKRTPTSRNILRPH